MAKILLVTLRSDHGGGPKHMLDLLRAFTKLNAQIGLYAASPLDPPYGHQFTELTKSHLELPHRRFSLPAFVRLAHFIRKHKIEVLHSHGRGAGVYSRLLKFLCPRLHVVHTFHGFHLSPGPIGALKVALDRALAPYADIYIAVSPDEHALLARNACLANVPCRTILNGVEINTSPISRSNSSLQMGLLARFDHQKGLDLLFENLTHLHRASLSLNWTFSIAGFEPSKVNVPPELENRVKIVGTLSNPRDFIRSLDLYVSNSRWEGLPLSVLEAMAEQRPCLLSRVPGHDYFIQSSSAFGFELDQPESFTKTALEVLANSGKRKDIANAGYLLIRKSHLLQDMALQTLATYGRKTESQ